MLRIRRPISSSSSINHHRRRRRRNHVRSSFKQQKMPILDTSVAKIYDSGEEDEEVEVEFSKVVKRRKKRKRPLNPEEKLLRQKVSDIEKGLLEDDIDLLKSLVTSDGGLLHDVHRRRVWPRLLGISMYETSILPTQEEIEAHPEYGQVVLDVNRSLKRFPPGIPEEQRPELQVQLTRLIIRVLKEHPDLHYYQGYHDIAITFLLVVGEELGFQIAEKLTVSHLKFFMAPTMEKTTYYLHFMYPIIEKESPELFEFLEECELGTIFALPWVITWFGHVLSDYSDVVRLYDFFMVQPPLMPVYMAAALVLHRQTEILLNCECDMAMVHALLSRIPVALPFEKLLQDSLYFYEKYPPSKIEAKVQERLIKADESLRTTHHLKIIKPLPPPPSPLSRFESVSWFIKKMVIITAPVIFGLFIWKFYNF